MRRLILGAVLVLLLPLLAVAKDAPIAEAFGGYSYYHAEGGIHLNGWNASVAGNVNDWLGIVGDFSGHYGDFHQHSYLFGPQISYRKLPFVTPFVHSLFGGAHVNIASQNAFAMALGGGVDFKVGAHTAVRAVQADYFMTRFGGITQNNARFSFGLVFRF
jgi:opacity protein-like surface antigen